MDVFTLRDNVEQLKRNDVIKAFNNSVRGLRKMLKGRIYAIDSTIVETSPDYPGCGKNKKEKKAKIGEPSSYEYFYGFRLFVLYEVKSRTIVAFTIVPANESEHKYFLPTIKQGCHNCGYGSIKVIVADRGFLCGENLWKLKHQMGIDFVVPAKKMLIVREDVIKLQKYMPCDRYSEWPYGKDKCKGYGVDGLLSYIDYNSTGIKRDSKKETGTPINAVVVTEWRGKKVSPEKQAVFLTSLPAENAAEIAEKYRLRSLIENCGFRELKQASFLKHIPRRKVENLKDSEMLETIEDSAYMHIILCVFAHTLFFAFLGWRRKTTSSKDESEQAIPMRQWRRKESIQGNKILVIAENKYYAFFEPYELLDIFEVKQDFRFIL